MDEGNRMRMNETRALTKHYANLATVQGEAYRLHRIVVEETIILLDIQ